MKKKLITIFSLLTTFLATSCDFNNVDLSNPFSSEQESIEPSISLESSEPSNSHNSENNHEIEDVTAVFTIIRNAVISHVEVPAGYCRECSGNGYCENAPPADRGGNGLGQIRMYQYADHEHSL